MSKLVFNRDGGKTDEFGHLIALMRFMQGEVIEGLQVAANGAPNMSVNVPYGIAAIPTGSGATGYRYFVGLDATENVTIPTANGSNPRNDLIVLWVDKAVTPSQSFTNNSNNMLKISVVSGAPATTPADPSVAAIQAAIGAANPYIVLARVTVGAGVTQINSGNITDLRSLAGMSRVLANMVTTAAIQDLAVTTAKLANGAVTGLKIAANTVSYANIDKSTFPKFSVYRSGALSAAAGVGTKFALNTVEYDTHNMFVAASNRIVIPAGYDGTYHVNARVSYTSTTMYGWIEIRKNGVLYKKGNLNTPNNEYAGHVVVADVPVVAGDYIELWYQTGQAVNFETGIATTYMQGRLLP